MRLLRTLAARPTLRVVDAADAIHLPPITPAAEMEDPPAAIENTLNLP